MKGTVMTILSIIANMPAGTEGGGNKPQSGYGLQAKI
jgi:hypothetical protein